MTAISNREDTPQDQRTLWWHFNRLLERYLPERLYARSLIIVIAPMLLLQGLMIYVFVDRHYETVTQSLSRSFVRDVALVMKTWEESPHTEADLQRVLGMANDDLALGLTVERDAELPPPNRKPFLSSVHPKLMRYIATDVGLPHWVDTVGQTGYVDVRIKTPDGFVFRFLSDLDRAHASTRFIFIAWMIGGSLILLLIAIIFLRNQIKPIVQLADAAQSFGMGRDVPDFRPGGAAEVQAAAQAFIKMKRRIERHVEQRTAMLAGVSHDLRTILTRFKLELALLEQNDTVRALQEDVAQMQRMLEGYMAFVKGAESELTRPTDVVALLGAVADEMSRSGHPVALNTPRKLLLPLKPDAFKRCIGNLAQNAARFAGQVEITAVHDGSYLRVVVDDDGPGIPPESYSEVFKPFVRLDNARNQDSGGTGLGLAIARDIAQSHGGDITLSPSLLGGLRAEVRIPT
ncbi:MAG: ATP-binding protein [Anderseniella sp.]|jgi:two-component system osmolarity sensor histidine kinase EnvZ|nr:ATP-binding protein [Anderseniella sp.]